VTAGVSFSTKPGSNSSAARSGLELPASCLAHCDELRATFKLPVGLFLYGPASKAGQVRAIAQHVDVIGEMPEEHQAEVAAAMKRVFGAAD
jgi:hypothetical protein